MPPPESPCGPPDAAGSLDGAHPPEGAAEAEPGAGEPERGRRERGPFRFLRDYVETVLVAVLIVLFTATFLVQNSVIPTASMEDTLLIGDYLLVNRIVLAPEDAGRPAAWLGQREPRRGDVVVFKFPGDPAVDYVKRVIGLPGDVVEVRAKQVLVNGVGIEEPYKRHKTGFVHEPGSPDASRDHHGPVTVPEGQLFVMGDNRDYSADSREWSFLPRDHVTGRALVIFWSRKQQPGTWQLHGLERVRNLARSVARLYSETRWERILQRVE